MARKAMIAMSGGVDSSVAAYLARKAGFECVGVMMRLLDDGDAGPGSGRTCCSLEDAEDARAAAYRLGMPFYVFNFVDSFRETVMEPFAAAYERGETPNPCLNCNRFLKFGRLLDRARELDCGLLVTGHYVRAERRDGRYVLRRAADAAKDQSYFLYSLTQEQLSRVWFPLGGMRKQETRRLAASLGLAAARKRDSEDVCFAPDGDYAAAIERCTGRAMPEGNFVDGEGRVLGRHRGLVRYTVGQRRGLGLSLPEPMYVRAIRPEDNTVVLGREEELWSRELDAADCRWISGEPPAAGTRMTAKLRSCQREQSAVVTPADGGAHVAFDEPQRAAAPGQAVVFYDGDAVLGGGIIRRGLH